MKITSPIIKCWPPVLALLGVVVVLLPSALRAQQFTTSGHLLKFYLMGTNGAASLYELSVGVTRSNVITVSASSRRYDVAATGNSVQNPNGAQVIKSKTPASRVGTPVVTNVYDEVYNYGDFSYTNSVTTLTAPFAIYLNDGGRVKGTISKTVYSGWTNWVFTGGATHTGKIGFGGNIFNAPTAMTP